MKIFRMFASSVLSLILAASVPVVAASYEHIRSTDLPHSQNALYVTTGDKASEETLKSLEDLDVTVREETLIEIVPVNKETITTFQASSKATFQSTSEVTALVVTNREGSVVSKAMFLAFGEDGNAESIIDRDMSAIETQGSTSVDFPPLSWDGRYVVTGVARYDELVDWPYTYYRPFGVSFTYVNLRSVYVGMIHVIYICDGFEYSYPGFRSLNLPEYEHDISVSSVNPVPYTTYQRSLPYRKDRVLWTSSGSPFVGQFLTFRTEVNGVSSGYTVKL